MPVTFSNDRILLAFFKVVGFFFDRLRVIDDINAFEVYLFQPKW